MEWAPGILHFKGLGMRNLQCEMRICQKSHNKVTMSVYAIYDPNFFGSGVRMIMNHLGIFFHCSVGTSYNFQFGPKQAPRREISLQVQY